MEAETARNGRFAHVLSNSFKEQGCLGQHTCHYNMINCGLDAALSRVHHHGGTSIGYFLVVLVQFLCAFRCVRSLFACLAGVLLVPAGGPLRAFCGIRTLAVNCGRFAAQPQRECSTSSLQPHVILQNDPQGLQFDLWLPAAAYRLEGDCHACCLQGRSLKQRARRP